MLIYRFKRYTIYSRSKKLKILQYAVPHLGISDRLFDSGWGGPISWDRNRRSNDLAIMRSNYFASFHEIKISYYYSISWLRHFSWDQNSKKALLANFDFMNNLLVSSRIMRSKFPNNIFLNFNLMNNLLAASAIMRSKLFKFIKLHLWLIFSPNY
jgi:hypothetical protein